MKKFCSRQAKLSMLYGSGFKLGVRDGTSAGTNLSSRLYLILHYRPNHKFEHFYMLIQKPSLSLLCFSLSNILEFYPNCTEYCHA